MNNKLVSLVRGVSIALGTVCNCGRDSAAGTLSLILLFTMPLISNFCNRATTFLPNDDLSGFIDLSDGALSIIRYLHSRLILGSSALVWLIEEKIFLSVSSDRQNLRQ